MSERLKVGEPVTVLTAYTWPVVVAAYVRSIHASASFGWEVEEPDIVRPRHGGMDYKHEGTRWLYGHHAIDSAEVRALLTANALSRAA